MFDKDLAKHLAELSKIEFSDSELDDISSDMTDIIAVMDKVRDFDCDTQHSAINAMNSVNLRKDIPKASLPTDEVLKNAAKAADNAFVVPKVV